MRPSTYLPPQSAARAIPVNEDPLVTRAKVCAQLRTALAEIESGDFGSQCIARAQKHLYSVQRMLFVARVQRQFPGLRVGMQGREAQA